MKPPRLAQSHCPAAEPVNEQVSARVLRGIALMNENRPESLRAAVREFEAAIKARRNLPFEDNPWFLYAHVAGWLNRADALTRRGGHSLERSRALLLQQGAAIAPRLADGRTPSLSSTPCHRLAKSRTNPAVPGR